MRVLSFTPLLLNVYKPIKIIYWILLSLSTHKAPDDVLVDIVGFNFFFFHFVRSIINL